MLSPEYKTRVECRFDSFCKKVMRNEARNCYKEIHRRTRHEVSLEYLMEKKYYEPSCMDKYFVIQSKCKPTIFSTNGKSVAVENEQLAKVLFGLPSGKRELILMIYFMGVTEQELATKYGCNRNTINYRKHGTLKLLRQKMEGLNREET